MSSTSGADMFLARFDASGAVQWVKRSYSVPRNDASENDEGGAAITGLPDGSSFVTGSFEQQVTFGRGEPHETTLAGTGYTDGFIARFGSDGTLSWAKRAGGAGRTQPWGITGAGDGSTFVTGKFIGTSTFGPGEPNETTLTSTPNTYSHFIARYNANGALVWAKRILAEHELTSFARWRSIAALPDGSLLFAGIFSATTTFAVGEAQQTVLTNTTGTMDMFIARYAQNGTLTWVKRASVGTSGNTMGATHVSIAARADGSAILVGRFSGSATFGGGEANETTLQSDADLRHSIFLARYAADGNLSSARIIARTSGGDDSLSQIVALSDGSALVSGVIAYRAVYGPSDPNETQLFQGHLFVARYGANDALDWLAYASSTRADSSRVGGIAALSDGGMIIAGSFRGVAYFGYPQSNPTSLMNDSEIGSETFVARYAAGGALTWVKRAGSYGGGDDGGDAITALPNGGAVVTGHFSGAAAFGIGEANEQLLLSQGDADVFVASYAADGSLSWVEQVGSTAHDHSRHIAALADSGAIVAGTCGSTCVLGAGQAGETTLAGGLFLARYASDGALAWATGVPSMIGIFGFAILHDESVLISGQYREHATFGKDEPHETTLMTGPDEQEGFVARFAPNGLLTWVRIASIEHLAVRLDVTDTTPLAPFITRLGNGAALLSPAGALASIESIPAARSRTVSAAVVLADGAIAIAGSYEVDDFSLDAGIFVAKLAPSGEPIWLIRAEGDFEPYGGPTIASFVDGSILLRGGLSGEVTFGASETNEVTVGAPGARGMYLARLNGNGTVAWARAVNDHEYRWSTPATAADGSIWMTGSFAVIGAFDDTGNRDLWLESAGARDAFVVRYGP